jgi:ABC-2 type transport system permease protein
VIKAAWRSIIRTLSFLRKEAVEVGRQPRLLLLLVVGPFLVLLLFGAGLRDVDPPIETLFVAPEGTELAEEVRAFADRQEDRLIVEGVTDDEEAALRRLRRGDVQLVVSFPYEVRETVRRDEQAVITLYHTQIDPVEGRAIELFMQTAVDEANQIVMAEAVGEAQEDSEDLQEQVATARERTRAVRTAARADDDDRTEEELEALRADLGALALAAPALALLDGAGGAGDEGGPLQERLDRIAEIIGEDDDQQQQPAQQIQDDELAELETELEELDEMLTEFRGLQPEVVVAPFRGEAVRVAGEGIELADFYAPAVAVVLLQHLLITALGLSLVRETELGTTELYRVAPLRPGELIIGKYLAHMLIGGVVAAALLGALIYGLGTPMLGDPWMLVAGVAAVLFASAGLGMLMSLAARSDSQAVQYAMLALLITVFFSGFMLSLERFVPEVGWVSWTIPATYGIDVLRDVMLRGVDPDLRVLGGLVAFGAGLALVSWFWMRRRLRTR